MVGREKLSVKLTRNKTHQQRVTFQKRKINFFKKASELSTLCDIPLCAIVFEPEFGGCSSAPPETWPQNHDEVRRVIDLYKSKMSNKRGIDLHDVCKRSNEQLKKQIERTRRQNHGDRLRWINALPLDQLREVLGTVDRNIGVMNAKIECMKNGTHLGLIEGPEAPEMIDNLVHVDPLDTLLLPMQYSSHDLQPAQQMVPPIEPNPRMMYLNGLDCSQIVGNGFMYTPFMVPNFNDPTAMMENQIFNGSSFGLPPYYFDMLSYVQCPMVPPTSVSYGQSLPLTPSIYDYGDF